MNLVAQLRGDLMLTGLDSRVARQSVSGIVMRLGMAWIDAGVLAAAGLVRVSLFHPGASRACFRFYLSPVLAVRPDGARPAR